MTALYNLGIFFYHSAIRIAALWNPKAKKWVQGRRGLWEKLSGLKQQNVIWFHCASLGEFEQGRPVLESLRQHYPEYKILLTFFSPSGYEQKKNFNGADLVTYMPLDTKRNAKRFLSVVKPKAVVFVKYEFWYHFLTRCYSENIPVYLVSAVFRKSQIFFKPYGGLFRELLPGFSRIFLQDEASKKLVELISPENLLVSGDTRFDRVKELVASTTLPADLQSLSGKKILVAGSTWPADEEILGQWWEKKGMDDGWKLVIAPHEISEQKIQGLINNFPGAVRYTSQEITGETQVLIIDTIGLLSRLYRVGAVAYVGGGFGKGIHNTLEAAAYGAPVIFGPNYHKFKEAAGLIECGAAFSISGPNGFTTRMKQLENNELLLNAGTAAKAYVDKNAGATAKVIQVLEAGLKS